MNWVETLNKVIDYIEDNLHEPLIPSQIASQVHISSAHLQRGFSALAGLTIGEYIRNRRLSLAGHELMKKDAKVIDIALKFGYETPESFSKAFSRFHGITPSAVKQNSKDLKSYSRLTIKIIMEGGSVMDYRIEEREAFDILAKSKMVQSEECVPTQIGAFWGEFLEAGLHKTIKTNLSAFGQMNDETKEFPYSIGDFYQEGQEIPAGFEVLQVPKNTWAIFKCVGALPEAIQKMWERVYSEWLPQANYELIGNYDLEVYLDGDSSSKEYISELWMSVKKK